MATVASKFQAHRGSSGTIAVDSQTIKMVIVSSPQGFVWNHSEEWGVWHRASFKPTGVRLELTPVYVLVKRIWFQAHRGSSGTVNVTADVGTNTTFQAHRGSSGTLRLLTGLMNR